MLMRKESSKGKGKDKEEQEVPMSSAFSKGSEGVDGWRSPIISESGSAEV